MSKFLYSGYVSEDNYYDDDNGIVLSEEKNGCNDTLLEIISSDLVKSHIINDTSKEDFSEECIVYDYKIPNVAIRIYISEEKISYEKAIENQILQSIGEFVANETWYGYSEYTILGFEVNTFKLIRNNGEHDLTKILRSYLGKFIWFELEIL